MLNPQLMPQQQCILVATGFDRPGVMDELANFILGHGGEVADSRAINLRGQFALLVLVSGSDDAIAGIGAEIARYGESIGIRAHLEEALGSSGGDTFPYRLTATGCNHPKVIQAMSHLMRVLNINIESLQTQETTENGPEQRQFRMELGLAVPREVPIVKLHEFLDHLCQEMHVEYTLATA